MRIRGWVQYTDLRRRLGVKSTVALKSLVDSLELPQNW